jgi:hypothetical protein
MRHNVDVVIIGSGPAAVAALSAAPRCARICIVTGATHRPIAQDARVHPKIRAVAYERGEAPGLTDFLPFDSGGRAGLFSTATLGGLANYWGQQFVRYQPGDPWPAEVFHNHGDYERTCSEIEAMFALTQVLENKWNVAALGEHYVVRTPRLVVGTGDRPQSSLHAMGRAFLNLAASHNARMIPVRATSLTTDGDGMCVTLSNGERLRGARIIVASGVLGTLRLVMTSCPELTAARFSDHNPYMLYTVGLDGILRVPRTKGYDHFNAITIERIETDCSYLFASVYRMSRASISLLLSAVGMPACFRGWQAPRFVDVVKPIQVWTAASTIRYQFKRNSVTANRGTAPQTDVDAALGAFVRCLKAHGVLLRDGAPEPGGGFHYHAAEVTADGVMFTQLCHYVEGRFEGRAICVDASVLREIGCRPHTLTAMASAHRLSNRIWSAFR